MNRGSSGLLAPKALFGFLQYKAAEGLSPTTLVAYEQILKVWVDRFGDRQIDRITPDDIRNHLVWLRTEYKPKRFSGDDRPLSPKSLHNAFIALCAFFAWASEEFAFENPMKAVPAPKFEEPPIEPFSKNQLEALLKVTEFKKEAKTERRKKFAVRRVAAKRDRAIILFLLDTGLRASELCSLTIGDVDQKTGRVEVKHGRCRRRRLPGC
jgi:integrase/recombinase XerD